MLKSKLACGPMSQEIIEAIFKYSHRFNKQLMLIASLNQVNSQSGYVFTTPKYVEYINKMRHKYPQANVLICRDHCGPKFNETINTLQKIKENIHCDLKCGFDMIHIDMCHEVSWSRGFNEKLQHTKNLMQFALNIKPDIMFEIGTDENTGIIDDDDEDKIICGVQECKKITTPVFYVVQTGSLIKENYNTGKFHRYNTGRIRYIINQYGVKLKEHNADYLNKEQLQERMDSVDAVNIAPQLGVVQTSHVLSQALIYGIDTKPFINEVVNGKKWEKWMCITPHEIYPPGNQQLYTLIAGHYHFNGPAYQNIIAQLSREMGIRESITDQITKVIEHYLFGLG